MRSCKRIPSASNLLDVSEEDLLARLSVAASDGAPVTPTPTLGAADDGEAAGTRSLDVSRHGDDDAAPRSPGHRRLKSADVVEELVHPESRPMVARLEEAAAAEHRHHQEVLASTPRGERAWSDWSRMPFAAVQS